VAAARLAEPAAAAHGQAHAEAAAASDHAAACAPASQDECRREETRAALLEANHANKKRNIVVAKALRAAAAGATAALMGKERKWDVLRLSNFRFSQQMLDFAARMRMAPWPDLFLTHFCAPHKPSWQDVHFLDGHLDRMVSDFLEEHAGTVRQQAAEAFNKQPHHALAQEQEQLQTDGACASQASRSTARRRSRPSRAAASRKRKASQSSASRRQHPTRATAAHAVGRPSAGDRGTHAAGARSSPAPAQAASPVIEDTEDQQVALPPQQLRSSSELTATTIHLQHLPAPASASRGRSLTAGHSVSVNAPGSAADARNRRQRRHQWRLEQMQVRTVSTPAVMATGTHGE